MKTIISTFALSLALCAVAGATAQPKSAAAVASTDTVMLSKSIDGNYKVCRYVVKSQNNADYLVRYQISVAKLTPLFDGNMQQLDNLGGFIDELMQDTSKTVTSATIIGYASPDGPMAFNESLAKRRAQDFKNYLDKKYDFSQKCAVTQQAIAEDWAACSAPVSQSKMANMQAVLNILDGSHSHQAKELALRKMPAAWSYLKKEILPSMRRVELVINYYERNIGERRMLIPKPTPAPQPAAPAPYEVVDETITGVIVEMPDKHDFNKMSRQEKREFRQVEKLAKREARIADKLAKKELKAAAKIDKKDAKQLRRMAKAEAKAAQKSAKELRRAAK
ncbi:MAG: hypothetical protein RR270_06345 [Alistipes sp.]